MQTACQLGIVTRHIIIEGVDIFCFVFCFVFLNFFSFCDCDETRTKTEMLREKETEKCGNETKNTKTGKPAVGAQIPVATQQSARRATALAPTPRRRRNSPA